MLHYNEIYLVETPQCGICSQVGIVEVPLGGFLAWQMGELIQDAFADLDPALREQLKTGTHPECYKQMIGQ